MSSRSIGCSTTCGAVSRRRAQSGRCRRSSPTCAARSSPTGLRVHPRGGSSVPLPDTRCAWVRATRWMPSRSSGWSARAAGCWPRGVQPKRARRSTLRSRYGAVRRTPTSPTKPGPHPRPPGSPNGGSSHANTGWRPRWPPGGPPKPSPRSKRWRVSIRSAKDCGDCSRSRCTAPPGRLRRWRCCARPGSCSPASWVSIRRRPRSCSNASCSPRRPSSTGRPRGRSGRPRWWRCRLSSCPARQRQSPAAPRSDGSLPCRRY